MSPFPVRKTANLSKGRVSIPFARYFITCCVERPEDRLVQPVFATYLMKNLYDQTSDKDFKLICATVMPDHVHLLMELGDRISLNRVISKYKAKTKGFLESRGIEWQSNFFEHRLRPDEAANPYALYTFLNPFRASLLPRKEEWPWWMRGSNFRFDFMTMLEDQKYPPQAWLTDSLDALGIDENFMGEHL